jgi:hypothetical protein
MADKQSYAKFQHQVCQNLRSSGVAALRQAKDCSFFILETPMETSAQQALSTTTSTSSSSLESLCIDGQKKGQAAVILTNTLVLDLTYNDAVLLQDSVKTAYNQAFARAGQTLDSFSALTATVAAAGADTTVVVGEYNQVCTPEDPSLKLISSSPTPQELAQMQFEFESTLCDLIRSGPDTFRFVTHCAYRTFGNPTVAIRSTVQVPNELNRNVTTTTTTTTTETATIATADRATA